MSEVSPAPVAAFAPDAPAAADGPDAQHLDLDRIQAELDGVEAALTRLDDGTYWSDEITGDELPDQLLAANPVARRRT